MEGGTLSPEMRGRLPQRVRIRQLETAASYAARLEEVNHLSPGTLRVTARGLVTSRTPAGVIAARTLDTALESLLEAAAELTAGHFRRQREVAGEAPNLPRYLCPYCAHGWIVEQFPHTRDYCCLKHRLWTGPGTTATKLRRPALATANERFAPPQVRLVFDDVLAAERRYRKLRARGLTSAALTAELVEVVTRPDPSAASLVTPENYPAVVSIAWLLNQRNFLETLLDPRRTYAQARAFLNAQINCTLPAAGTTLRDALWLLLRPTFLRVREQVQGEPLGRELGPLISIDCHKAGNDWIVQRPLEPFSRFLDQLEAPRGSSWPECAELFVVAGSYPRPRAAIPSHRGPTLFICAEGHVIRRYCSKVARALAADEQFCPICSGKQALSGYNSLAETNPLLARQWDHQRNGELEPSDVVSRSNKVVQWVCPTGHRYPATVANRALNGSGCAVCANFAVLVNTNDLATTHPALAAEWHPHLNGDVRPEHVISGSGNKFAWLCPNGHTYWKEIQKRKSGQGCTTCSGRHVAEGVNDLATTHPRLAAEWHPHKNGNVTPQQLSYGSDKSVYWLCPKGHEYQAPVNNRTGTKRAGCPFCSNRKLWRGYNDLVSQYPDLARDWAADLNHGLSAAEVLPGNKLRGWRCALGHEQHMMFRNRLRAKGCTECPADQRAGQTGRR